MPITQPPDYFRTLDAFRTYCLTPRALTPHSAPKIAFEVPKTTKSSSILVCHDYKGGYCERDNIRGYSFFWWHLTDTFIYFAHHRISIPPAGWITAAHRNGTKILGTLIFEGNDDPTSSDSILSLILGSRLNSFDPKLNNFDSLLNSIDTELADRLVDLCIERGFEGYLINIEVELGIKKYDKWIGGNQCAVILKLWIEYLTSEIERRVVGGEVVWYDAVTIEGQSHRWQNKLSPLNLPYFLSSSSIFLNYFWNSSHLNESIDLVDTVEGKERNQVYVGIDVFGRGQYGGGGFFSYLALDCITEASERPDQLAVTSNSLVQTTSPTSSSQLSVAIFAPGWSDENFQHNLTTKEGHLKWLKDDFYLWEGGEETENVKKEQIKRENERKQERGIKRARDLAKSSINGIGTSLEEFDYNAPLPNLPGAFRSITSYVNTPRTPPSPNSIFYTNFSNGSGHNFWFEGVKVLDSINGWTRIDFSYPQASLLYYSPTEGVISSLYEEDGWIGALSLSIKTTYKTKGEILNIPLCPASLLINSTIKTYKVNIIWKSIEGESNLGIYLGGNESQNVISIQENSIIELKSGWLSTTAFISIPNLSHSESICISSIGIKLTSTSSLTSSILIGSLSISTSYNSLLPQPIISAINYPSSPSSSSLSTLSSTSTSINWSIIHALPSTKSISTSNPLEISNPPHLASWPRFEFYLIFKLNEDGRRGKCLGFTSASEIDLEEEGEGGKVLVVGVKNDGEIVY